MRRGDIYEHFNGEDYVFVCIALPLKDELNHTTDLTKFKHNARYHENTHDIDLYTSVDGALFIDSELPHVLYHTKKDVEMKNIWARELDSFFGYKKMDKGLFIKRFTLKV